MLFGDTNNEIYLITSDERKKILKNIQNERVIKDKNKIKSKALRKRP